MDAREELDVRPATAADHPAVQALAGELTVGVPPWRSPDGVAAAAAGWVREACDAGAGGDRTLLVAVDTDGAVLGLAGVTARRHSSGDREGCLGELVVAPPARRRGVASRLVAESERWARSRGLDRLTLETGSANTAARAVYAALGYAEEQVTLTRDLR
jgi:GNAT superfamily N-acetyltransferase